MEHMYMLWVHKLTKHALHSDAVLVAKQARLTRVATSFKQIKLTSAPHVHVISPYQT